MVKFNNTTILNQAINEGRAKQATAGARVSEAEKAALDRMAAEEGLSPSDFVRQALKLRALFRGADYYKLITNAADIADILSDQAVPPVVDASGKRLF